MDGERKKRIDKAVAKFFYACNIPFVISESEYFIDMLRELDQEYTLPSRKTIADTLLNNIYEEHRASVWSDKIQDGILLIDGWKNSVANTKNIVAIVRTTNGENLFLDSWNFSDMRETGEALSMVVNECIDNALNQFNIKIYCVVTDNASNMINMGRRVDIWHLTCNSHSGNLLFKSLTDNDLAKKVSDVVKDFKSPSMESQLIRAGGLKMIVAGETRWCSKRDSFKRVLENIDVMRNIIRDNQLKEPEDQYNFQNDVIATVLDDQIEMQLINALLHYDPVCELVNSCQNSNCSISYATEKWLSLTFPHGDNDEVRRVLNERLTKVINKYNLAANYINSNYKGRRFLNNPQYSTMKDEFFNENLSAAGKVQLVEYHSQTGFFEQLFRRQLSSWKNFWRTARPFYPELSNLAEKLLNISASTGDLERLFSEWTYVHSKTRNRLKETR